MLGKAAVAMWWDVAPEVRAEWEHWHSTSTCPSASRIPGFLRGTRWVADSGEPSYFVLYEVDGPANDHERGYLTRLNNPTPWSRKMMPHHRNMVRSLCTVRAGWGGGVPQALATVRFPRTPNLPEAPRRGRASPARTCSNRSQCPRRRPPSRKSAAATRPPTGCCSSAATRRRSLAPTPLPEGVVGFYRPAYSLSAGEIA